MLPSPCRAIISSENDIVKVLLKYRKVSDVVWAQEEPRNMGAYAHMLMHIEAVAIGVLHQEEHTVPSCRKYDTL